MIDKRLFDFYSEVYGVLVEYVGAPDAPNAAVCFARTVADEECGEYRFCGSLGLGGKYYPYSNVVSCYSEDRTPERDAAIAAADRALRALKAKHFPEG